MKGTNSVDEDARQCAALLKTARSLTVLTGAGISTGAGIPDFRGTQGLYATGKYDPDKIFDIRYFLRDPQLFYTFARDFLSLLAAIRPTFGHRFLRQLEETGTLKGLITQNIDSLHHQAGSKKVVELHGSFIESYCLDCRKKFSYAEMKDKIFAEPVPKCRCSGIIKPDIVFFGEEVKNLEVAFQLARAADVFLVIGTSCVVYPAAILPQITAGKIIVVNRDPVALPSVPVALQVEREIDSFFEEVAKY